MPRGKIHSYNYNGTCMILNKPCFKKNVDCTACTHIKKPRLLTKRTCYCCGKELEFSFNCGICGEEFCEDHHVPESHGCEYVRISSPYRTVDTTEPIEVQPRLCKEKNNERCYEEADIILPERYGCPKCTDPKVLIRRRKKARIEPNLGKICAQSDHPSTDCPTSKINKESIFNRLFKKIFGKGSG